MQQKIQVIQCPTGHYLTNPGQLLTGFYIIQSGSFTSIERDRKEQKTLLAGDFFGIEACLTDKAYQKTNYALEESAVLLIKKDEFITLFQEFPSVGIKVMNYFSKTLRKINEDDTKALSSEEESRATEEQTELALIHTLLEAGSYFFNQKAGLSCSIKIYSYLLDEYSETLAEDLREVVQSKISTLYNQGALPQTGFPDEMTTIRLAPNRLIFAEGEVGRHLFTIEKGSVDIFRIIGQKKIVIARLEEGEIFGEMALLESKPRSAGAMTSDGQATLRCIPQGQFNSLIETSPDLTLQLATLFASRIREADRRRLNHNIVDQAARVYDRLLLELEKENVNIESSSPYILNFSGRDVCEKAGLSTENTNAIVSKMIQDSNLKLHEKKIAIHNLVALKKTAHHVLYESKKREEAERLQGTTTTFSKPQTTISF